MKGDFSKWGFEPKENFNGVLHQQGRVLLDSDWNEQTQATLNWQDHAARDTMGPGVAAVPAHEGSNFKINNASINLSNEVELTITPGRIWADGISVYLPGKEPNVMADVTRTATYLPPPFHETVINESDIEEGVRDAVILEVWREEINGFQIPEALIEPALGGPDTTERVYTAFAFRLLRLEPSENCNTLRSRLRDEISLKGTLSVTLQLPDEIPGDCPVVEGGGYTGFEHHLYRIEIAEVNNGTPPMFKWSQFNGGLVGRGTFSSSTIPNKVSITANLQPILTSGFSEFYLEAVEFDNTFGHWKVTYGAEVTLNADGELDLPASPMFGDIPDSVNSVFFRLWNGIQPIREFSIGLADTNELRDGIRLEFAAATEVNYSPGDYWTFKVRAGEISNPEELIKSMPPEGVRYHRVPLAELNWNSEGPINFDDGQIEDCRKIFPPLTDRKGCCTYHVGDGVQSFGDFNSIEDALRHLPAEGGKICVLNGIHYSNVRIIDRKMIEINGCGEDSIIIPRPHETETAGPIFFIQSSEKINIENLTLLAPNGTAIDLEDGPEAEQASRNIIIRYNRIVASVHAIRIICKNDIAGDNNIWIAYNLVGLFNKAEGLATIFTIADEVVIERNKIMLVYEENSEEPDDPEDPLTRFFNPCWHINNFYSAGFSILNFIYSNFFQFHTLTLFESPRKLAQGGIQIGDSSEKVKIVENKITGGWGHGVTLGSEIILETDEEDQDDIQLINFEHHNFNTGQIMLSGNPYPRSGLNFEFQKVGNSLTVISATTDANGKFNIGRGVSNRIEELGEYRVTIITPGFKIDGPIVEYDTVEYGMEYRISIIPIQEEEKFAFLYDISVENNEISYMGSSGIGGLDFLENIDNNLIVRIEELTIYRNKIRNCAKQMPVNLESLRVIGGIILGFCENCKILENRIEEIGNSEGIPFCGLFILYGELLDISSNFIITNETSEMNNQRFSFPKPGGGIFINMAFDPISYEPSSIQNPSHIKPPYGFPQLRVCNNVVSQSLGQALVLITSGPVSISVVNNSFISVGTSELIYRSPLAATVCIFNIGEINYIPNDNRTRVHHPETNYNNFLFNLPNNLMPNGKIMFADNQITHNMRNSTGGSSLSSIFIFSPGDIAFANNQSECASSYNDSDNLLMDALVKTKDGDFEGARVNVNIVRLNIGVSTLDHPIGTQGEMYKQIHLIIEVIKSNIKVNTILIGDSTRAISNMFLDWTTATRLSLISTSLINTATGNQATKCLSVMGTNRINEHNIILYNITDAECSDLGREIRNSLGLP